MELGFPRSKPFDFDILPFNPCSPTGAESFESGFFRGKSRRKMDRWIDAILAISLLSFRIYSVKEPVAEFFHGFPDAIVLNDVDSDADDHELMLQVNRVSQITLLSSPALQLPQVVHAFSTRRAEHNHFTLGGQGDPLAQM